MPSRNAKVGLWLFAVYVLLYGGFVMLAAFSPATMAATPATGVNLAIWYGFGLIVAAVVLALIYGWSCRPSEPVRSDPGETRHPNLGEQEWRP
jgi:uncharacterized membrane protein (DUF485 family)